MPMGSRNKEDLNYMRRQIKDIPMLALAGSSTLGIPDFQAAGYQIVIYPSATIQASIRAIYDVYEHLVKTGTMPEQMSDTRELMSTLSQLPEKWAIEEEIGHNR